MSGSSEYLRAQFEQLKETVSSFPNGIPISNTQHNCSGCPVFEAIQLTSHECPSERTFVFPPLHKGGSEQILQQFADL